jgi:hypothetical protein
LHVQAGTAVALAKRLVGLLRRLKVEDLQKSARHPELDHRVTVGDYVRMMSKHGPNHLEHIERLKKEAIGK